MGPCLVIFFKVELALVSDMNIAEFQERGCAGVA